MSAAIPDTLIRLVSQYVCPFGTSTLISELFEYDELQEKIATIIVMHFIDSRDKLPVTNQMINFIMKNIKSMLIFLLDNYDPILHKNILHYLVTQFCTDENIIDVHCILNNINFNLNDFVILQGCIRKNTLFLNDFIGLNHKLIEKHISEKLWAYDSPIDIYLNRSDWHGNRINYNEVSKFRIAIRDLFDYLLLTEDIDSVRFIMEYFKTEISSRLLHVKGMMNNYKYVAIFEHCPKTLEYLKEWQ